MKEKKTGETTGVKQPVKSSYKVSKIMLNPSRKIALPGYENMDVNAGIEVTFDVPVDFDSPELIEALNKAREVVVKEFRMQWDAFRNKKEAPKKTV